MRNFNKVTTLAEDMAVLGLGGQPAAATDNGSLTEATLKRVRTKRTTSSEKAKARMKARKNKAKTNRARRMLAKKTTYKNKMKRLKKMKKGKKGGPRTQLRLVTGLERQGSLFENFNMGAIDQSTMSKADVVAAFENVSSIAGTMARKFAVLEELMESGLEVIHPESEHGYDVDTSNAVASGKTGDAMDTTAQAPSGNVTVTEPKAGTTAGEVEEGDEDPVDPVAEAEDDEVTECDDEDMTEEDELEEEEELEEEDDLEEAETDEVQESVRRRVASRLESMPISFEMNAVRLEAENMAAQVDSGSLSPIEAGAVLGDMVSYLGGGMKMYADLANDFQTVYLGTGNPEAPAGNPKPEDDKENPEEYVGQGAPEGDSALNQGGGPKPDQTTTAPATPAKKVGEAEPKAEAKAAPAQAPMAPKKIPKLEAKAPVKAAPVKAPAKKPVAAKA